MIDPPETLSRLLLEPDEALTRKLDDVASAGDSTLSEIDRRCCFDIFLIPFNMRRLPSRSSETWHAEAPPPPPVTDEETLHIEPLRHVGIDDVDELLLARGGNDGDD